MNQPISITQLFAEYILLLTDAGYMPVMFFGHRTGKLRAFEFTSKDFITNPDRPN